LEVGEEVGLVLEVGFAAGTVGRVVIEVGQWLMVPLEIGGNLGRVSVGGGLHGRIPSARVPLPGNTGLAEQVADVQLVRPIRVVGIAVVDGRQQVGIGGLFERGHQVL